MMRSGSLRLGLRLLFVLSVAVIAFGAGAIAQQVVPYQIPSQLSRTGALPLLTGDDIAWRVSDPDTGAGTLMIRWNGVWVEAKAVPALRPVR